MLRVKERALIPCFSIVFSLGLTFESFKELGACHEMLRAKEHTPTIYPYVVFTFGFVVESIKEFGSVSDSFLQFLGFIINIKFNLTHLNKTW